MRIIVRGVEKPRRIELEDAVRGRLGRGKHIVFTFSGGGNGAINITVVDPTMTEEEYGLTHHGIEQALDKKFTGVTISRSTPHFPNTSGVNGGF